MLQKSHFNELEGMPEFLCQWEGYVYGNSAQYARGSCLILRRLVSYDNKEMAFGRYATAIFLF